MFHVLLHSDREGLDGFPALGIAAYRGRSAVIQLMPL
jgi:hypothetical protein